MNALSGLQDLHKHLEEHRQSDLPRAMQIMGDSHRQALQETYHIAFAFNDTALSYILRALVRENRMVAISGFEHVIGIAYSNGEYRLYDANEPAILDNITGSTVWKNLDREEVVKQLKVIFLDRLGYDEADALPLSLRIFMKPSDYAHSQRSFLSKMELLDRLCTGIKSLNDLQGPDGFTPLHVAAFRNDYEAVSYFYEHGLLQQSDTINQRDDKGRTPLHLAILRNNLEIANLLIRAKADCSLADERGYNALHFAAQFSAIGFIRQLCTENPNLLCTAAGNGDTPLMSATGRDDVEMVRFFLEEGLDPNTGDEDGLTPLMVATTKGSIPVMQEFIRKKVNLNAEDASGKTALHHAAEGSELECFKLLVKNGADLLLRDQKGRLPLDNLLAYGNYYKIHELLRFAVEVNNMGLIAELLRRGANPNVVKIEGMSLLDYTSKINNPELTKLLLQHGAILDPISSAEGFVEPLQKEMKLPSFNKLLNMTKEGELKFPYARNENGETILHYFAKTGDIRGVKLALQNRSHPNMLDNNGFCPLFLAAERGHLGIVKLLLGEGADPNLVVEEAKTTALYLAAKAGHKEVVRLLLERGANPDLVTGEGKTALYAAIENHHDDIAMQLLDCGANPNIYGRDAEGTQNATDCLPLLYACNDDNLPLIKRLLEAGADPTINVMYLAGFVKPVTLAFDESVTEFLEDGSLKHFLDESPIANLANKAAECDLEYFKQQNKAVLFQRTLGGESLLHIVVRHERGLELVKYLLDQGLDVNAKDFYGDTPLHIAALEGHKEIVELLLSRKDIQPDIENKAGISPHENAKLANNFEVMELIKYKKESSASASSYDTAIASAAAASSASASQTVDTATLFRQFQEQEQRQYAKKK